PMRRSAWTIGMGFPLDARAGRGSCLLSNAASSQTPRARARPENRDRHALKRSSRLRIPRHGIGYPALRARLFLFPHLGRGCWSFAHDQEHCVLVLGAVPMHLLAEMSDEAAGGHRHAAVLRIEFGTRTDPPGALQHNDIAVVGMEMRMAEMIALGP